MANGFFLFPGQGAQAIGMAKDVFDAGGHAVALFDEASEILGFDLARMVFEGDDATLAKTENCQPALLVSCLALLNTMRERRSVRLVGAAGLSLGEYTALVALDALDFADAVQLVRRRGELMERAGRGRDSGMSSVIGLDAAAVEKVCADVTASGAGMVTPANYNCPGQIVVSGDKAALVKAAEALKAAGARRVLPLNVSAAFHSPLMEPAGQALREALADVPLRKPSGKFINNADARELSDPEAIRDSLARQVYSPVRWEQTCRLLVNSGEKRFYEVGPGGVCAGLMRRTASEVVVTPLSTLAEIEALAE